MSVFSYHAFPIPKFQYTTYITLPVLMKTHIPIQATETKRTEENNTSHTYRSVKHAIRTPTQGKNKHIYTPSQHTNL
jgi:hypothetical protein